ncbi:hypothetical protein F8388_008924 [Cannabis sativa]|uniref:Uncharacterized protein n=2 Tax=Cannabis sativa TaxID=3483 RepID=A0A7J6HAC8_CANSA|nr:hypothetical protein F8388_008924 [Cannabis sativa]
MYSCPLSSDSQEGIIESLKDKLVCTMLELESAKKELKQEKEKTQKVARKFLHLNKVALQEKYEAQKQRDEVRNQLHILIKASTSSDYDNISINTAHTQPYYAAAATTEAPTLTSSSSSTTRLEKQPQVVGMEIISNNRSRRSKMRKRMSDNESFVCNSLIEEGIYDKPLPKKGRLLQAVVEAGPLLQTLLIAPLPQWNNPPTPITTLPMPLPLPVFQDSIIANLPY